MIYKITPNGLVQRLLNRLYSIQVGTEEYLDGNAICLARGIKVLLEDDYSIDRAYDIIYSGDRLVVLKKNPDLCNNLSWFSLVSGNIEIYRLLCDIMESLLVLNK